MKTRNDSAMKSNDEYDEKIAANEPDMTFELKEVDLEVCERSR